MDRKSVAKTNTKSNDLIQSPNTLIQFAIEKGADLDKLEKLLDMQLRWEANQAKKAYVSAMAAFKENPPVIEKDKEVNHSGITYKHASLANVTKNINESLSKHGLSSSWKTNQDNGVINITCKITHEMGHSEETTLSAPADNSGKKNSIQAIGSTITYLQRYSLLSITGLATEDQDDDAQGVTEVISEDQLSQLVTLMDSIDVDHARFASYMGVTDLRMIPLKDFPKARTSIEGKIVKMEREKKEAQK